jgi:2-C-methyl-D-erythritol 4-phosphate cytidylyltransferase
MMHFIALDVLVLLLVVMTWRTQVILKQRTRHMADELKNLTAAVMRVRDGETRIESVVNQLKATQADPTAVAAHDVQAAADALNAVADAQDKVAPPPPTPAT